MQCKNEMQLTQRKKSLDKSFFVDRIKGLLIRPDWKEGRQTDAAILLQ